MPCQCLIGVGLFLKSPDHAMNATTAVIRSPPSLTRSQMATLNTSSIKS